MLASLHNYYKEGSPRLFPELQSWFDVLNIRLNKNKEKYLKVDHLINGVQQKLINVLNIIDIPYLAKQSQDEFYVYINYFKDIKEQVEGLYNIHNSAHPTKNQYIKKIDHVCTEVTVPLFDLDYLSIWPMGKPYSYWKNTVTPLYLQYHDSPILNYDIKYDRIIFRTNEPNIAIFFIDIPSLCMRYFKWYLQSERKDIYSFITHEVWYNIFDQLQHIWVFRQHELAIAKVAGSDISSEVNFNNNNQVKVGSRYTYVMDRLYDFYKEVSEGKVLYSTVFSSKLFNYKNNKTFRDLVSYQLSHMDIPSFSQYSWIKTIRDYQLLSYLCSVYLLNSKSPRFSVFRNSFVIQWNKLLSKSPWDYIKDTYLKEWFKKKMDLFNSVFL